MIQTTLVDLQVFEIYISRRFSVPSPVSGLRPIPSSSIAGLLSSVFGLSFLHHIRKCPFRISEIHDAGQQQRKYHGRAHRDHAKIRAFFP